MAGVFEGEDLQRDSADGALGAAVASGEARHRFKTLAVVHVDGVRYVLAGLGKREQFTPERARVAAAVAHDRAREISTRKLCWELPSGAGADVAGALVEGTVLASYRFEGFRAPREDAPPPSPDAVVVSVTAPDGDAQLAGDVERAVAEALTVSENVLAARDLQNRPGNDLTPTALGEEALRLGRELAGLTVEVEGREGIVARGMGAFAAVAQGSDQEPALITLRYEGPDARGPVLGYVGKAVTFDSGGISLKPGLKMSEMKFDMSGGAAVLRAIAAIAQLRLPVRLVGVIGSTENLPSGHAIKPGDIVTASNGTTIEINNTDAEGRLVLADCISHAISVGAERLVDVATLTGAVLVALGSTHAGLMSNDDEWAEQVDAAARQTGEIVWRLPLHAEYAEAVKGRYADLDNAPEDRKAGTIVGAEFLHRFAGDVPWVHLDIAGTAWDLGRAYAQRGATGFGVRLLTALAQAQAQAQARV